MTRKKEDKHHFFQGFEDLRKRLKEFIFDQDDAIDEIADAFIHMACRPEGISPKGMFTFFGPSAVGKRFLARSLSRLLEGYSAFIQFDMEQYSDPEGILQLIGPKGSMEGRQEGELLKFVREFPRSIIFFENIEKADNQLQLALLSLLTHGDPESNVHFKESIIIFTSTLGSSMYQNRDFLRSFRLHKLHSQDLLLNAISSEKKVIFDMIQPAIAPKMLEAMARNFIILFNRLSLDSMVKIGSQAIHTQAALFTEKSGVRLELKDFEEMLTLLVLSLGPRITCKRVMQRLPDVFLGRITRNVRENKEFPRKVVFKVTKQARNFLDSVKSEGDVLFKLFKKGETVILTWKEYTRGSSLFLSIDKARMGRIPVSDRLVRETRPLAEFSAIDFHDIAGNKATKNTLKQIIKLLKNPAVVARFGLKMPKGMLLYGPPGVGKTMLGKAFAKETGRPYVYASRSDLFDPEYIRKVYKKAREYAPSIVFLDGIDVKGLMEGVYTTMPDDQLLLEIDSLTTDPDNLVFTLATAQNRFEVPQAILAPDRVDTFVEVPELDREARRFFIDKILEKPNDGKINVERVIRYISGMSGYDLQRIGKEASLYAIRNGLEFLTEDILIEQINIIKYGYKLEKKRIRNLEEDLRITAFHEAGHAVLSYLLLPDIKIEQVTIAPRLEALGFISYTPEDFPGNISRDEIFNNMCVLVAGRISSMKKFGSKGLNTGAANDLEQATHQAYAAVASLGMDEKIGYVHTDTLSQNVSKQIFLRQVEKQVQHWVKVATDTATLLVDKNWSKIEKLAAILIQYEIVDGADLVRIMKEDPE